MTRYNINLAAEFDVLSKLHRLGADATPTLGNKTGVDIVVVRDTGDDAIKKTLTLLLVPGKGASRQEQRVTSGASTRLRASVREQRSESPMIDRLEGIARHPEPGTLGHA